MKWDASLSSDRDRASSIFTEFFYLSLVMGRTVRQAFDVASTAAITETGVVSTMMMMMMRRRRMMMMIRGGGGQRQCWGYVRVDVSWAGAFGDSGIRPGWRAHVTQIRLA
jgi:hypothetical protein